MKAAKGLEDLQVTRYILKCCGYQTSQPDIPGVSEHPTLDSVAEAVPLCHSYVVK